MKRSGYQPAFLLLLFFLFAINCSLVSALDFSFRPKGFVFIPMGAGSVAADGGERYSTGGGGDIGFEIDLSTVWPTPFGLGYTVGLEGGLLFAGVNGELPLNASFYSLGAGVGLYFFPFSRLLTRIDGAIGVYQSVYGGEKGPANLFLRGGGELGFRFTPSFTIAANAGWRQFMAENGAFNSGIYAGLTAQITFQIDKNSSGEGTSVTLDQYEAVYPAFMRLYQSSPIGSAVIRNNENAEIRDVQVSFRASGYTASEYPCGEVSIIPRGRKAELPLFADFSADLLRFTDEGRILGEVVIRYRFLGKQRETVRTIIVSTKNRNAVSEGDISALAAFISPTSPDTLEYSKYVASLARSSRRAGHNWNFQYAVWLFECLRSGGIRLGETYSADNEAQFPAETLAYGTGNSRDLALLFASCLEGVGISSAFVEIEGDFLAAVSLGVNASEAETLFNGTDKILVINDTVWLPLSMSAFNEGFSSAWAKGAEVLGLTFEQGKEADFVMVEEAWSVYPPAPLGGQGGRITTNTETASREANRAMTQYIDQEIAAVLRQVQAQLNASPTMTLYNRMGIVLARAGRIAETKTNYERAAGMGSVPAMTNRGNLALMENDLATAERFFRQALSRESENNAALRGLEQIAERR